MGPIDRYLCAMETLVIDSPEAAQKLVGRQVGPTDWRVITQEMVNLFADLSDDHQWIHIDVDRAKKESPFGGPVAHGNLTLSMVDGFVPDLLEFGPAIKMGVNYGWNKVRFPSPVPVGSKVRASAEIIEAKDLGGGWTEIVTRFTLEVQTPDGEVGQKPCCVAESVDRLLE